MYLIDSSPVNSSGYRARYQGQVIIVIVTVHSLKIRQNFLLANYCKKS